MSQPAVTSGDDRHWAIAAAVALAAHLGVAGLALGWSRPHEPPMPEPVVLIELPPDSAPAPMPAIEPQQAQSQPQPVRPQTMTPPIDAPQVRAPLPQNPVTLPPPTPPQPSRTSAPAPASAGPSAPAQPGAATGPAPGDPKAKRAELDYFSLVSSHLNRRKSYPNDAKKARQEGVVTVRFTVDRNGNVSNVSVRRSSGHAILDSATLQLLQRVAPLPRMPAAMQRETVTVSLPIDYALKTS